MPAATATGIYMITKHSNLLFKIRKSFLVLYSKECLVN